MKEYKYDVFVSYSRKDDVNFLNDTGTPSPIDQILKRLEKESIKIWIDREGKYGGKTFPKEISQAIDNSELVLFISSAYSNGEEAFWIFREVNYAAEMKREILPLLLDDTPFNDEIKLIFSGKDRIEYYKNPTKGLNNLVDSIKKHIERKKVKDIEKHITHYAEKLQACIKDLWLKENKLNDCPVCRTSIDIKSDYCDICGWHFATPKELLPLKMQQMYEERLHTSQTIWIEKQQQEKEIESLKKEIEKLKSKLEVAKQPIAFLLVTEFDQTNVYCLYIGKNVFGAMQFNANQSNYQMLVVSDNNLHPQHFEINIKKEGKRFVYSISPINETCILALNSQSNVLKTKIIIQIYDVIYIGKVKIQIIDNFNKTV